MYVMIIFNKACVPVKIVLNIYIYVNFFAVYSLAALLYVKDKYCQLSSCKNRTCTAAMRFLHFVM